MTSRRFRIASFALAVAALGATACSVSSAIVPTETAGADESTSAIAEAAATAAVESTSAIAEAAATAAVESTSATAEAAEVVVVESSSVDITDEVAPVDAVSVATETAPAGAGVVNINFDDGRSWTMPSRDCYTSPDSPFGIFFMSGVSADGADLGVVESWPLDGDRTGGTAFIGTFLDEAGDIYIIEGGPVVEADGGLSFTSAIYEGLALEPTINATFRCTP